MPHDFILDYLYPLEVTTKKMFGNHAIYVNNKIVLAIRDNVKKPIDNGLWVGTTLEHHESLKIDFPSLVPLQLYNIKKWLLLPVDAEDFETAAIAICELIKNNDPRIGVAIG